MPHANIPKHDRDQGVTRIIELEPKKDAAADLEAVISEWRESLDSVAGHLGTGVFRSCPPYRPLYRVVSQFDAVGLLQEWEAAETRQRFIERVGSLSKSTVSRRLLSGSTSWFDAVSWHPHQATTTRLKMTVVMFLGMFPVSIGLHHAFKYFPQLLELPSLLNAAILAAVVTAITMNVAMPILTYLLRGWLYPDSAEAAAEA